MKKLLSLIFLAGAMVFTISCGDEETPDAPTVTAPTAVTDVEAAEDVEITFTIAAPGGFASASVAAVGGTAVVTTPPAAGATTGSVVVTFSAGLEEGAGSVTLTVTDDSDQTASATAVVNISAEVTVSGNITEDETWETGKVYILGGRVAVTNGATLTIEPGVIVKGQAGTGANSSALVIARGAKIMAEGTADAPIIFTALSDEISPADVAAGEFASPNLDADVPGLWGGLLVLGNAPISASNDNDEDVSEVQIEGIPTSDTNGLYGGTDAADNSGVLKYISIRHGGTNIGAGNEINGLTLGGVGSGTVIENIEVVANDDDGIEWFGGTVNVSNVVVWNSVDDAIDTDQSWAGTLDNFIIVTPAGSCFELDGPEGSFEDGHIIQNGTIVAGADADALIDVDANSMVQLNNLFFKDMVAGQTIDRVSCDGNGCPYTNIQLLLPGSTALADFLVGATTGVTAVTTPTTGADASVFAWTWASQSGVLTGL